MNDINKKKKIILTILIISISLILVVALTLLFLKNITDKKKATMQNELYEKAISFCEPMFINKIIKDNIQTEDIDSCLEMIEKVDNKKKINDLKNDVLNAKEYINFKNNIDEFYEDGILKSSITQQQIDDLYKQSENLIDEYKKIITKKIDSIKNEYDDIFKAKEAVNNLFDDSEKTQVISNITRTQYNNAKTLVEKLKDSKVKEELESYLKKALEVLNIKEEEMIQKEEEIRRQKEEEQNRINNAWIKLKVPYISQNKSGVNNGCEIASLLMALKYKGYLSDMDLVTYAENVPKSDDPNTGFYLDIFNKEPSDVAHWIAPKPLVEYGISSSGNTNIINATGWNLSDLDKEVANNNPVIIYLTFGFESPRNWSNGVPNNLHVLLITGYNTITEDQVILDPWYHSNGDYEYILSKKLVESLYNQIGKKAVIIR